MKKYILVCFVVLNLVALSCFAQDTGQITLKGVIPAQTSIEVNPADIADKLDLLNSASDLKVAEVIERNNTPDGYTVTLTSQNEGSLNNGKDNTIKYSAKYAGKNAQLKNTPVVITDQGPQTRPIQNQNIFSITYKGVAADQAMAGEYSDLLTFTIKAK